MTINYEELVKKMKKKGYTQAKLAVEIGYTPGALSLKLNNIRGFNQMDMIKIANILNIKPNDFGKYFFTQNINDK